MTCITRQMVKQGHSIDTEGIPQGYCEKCEDISCHYVGPVCGCGESDCVDEENDYMGMMEDVENDEPYL